MLALVHFAISSVPIVPKFVESNCQGMHTSTHTLSQTLTNTHLCQGQKPTESFKKANTLSKVSADWRLHAAQRRVHQLCESVHINGCQTGQHAWPQPTTPYTYTRNHTHESCHARRLFSQRERAKENSLSSNSSNGRRSTSWALGLINHWGGDKVDPVSEPDKMTGRHGQKFASSQAELLGCVGVGCRLSQLGNRATGQLHLEHGNCFGRPLKAQTNYLLPSTMTATAFAPAQRLKKQKPVQKNPKKRARLGDTLQSKCMKNVGNQKVKYS